MNRSRSNDEAVGSCDYKDPASNPVKARRKPRSISGTGLRRTLSGFKSLSARALMRANTSEAEGDNEDASCTSSLSTDTLSVSSPDQGMRRKNGGSGDLRDESTQDLQRNHRGKLRHSWTDLSSGNIDMPEADNSSNVNATWSVGNDSSRPNGLRKTRSNRLLNAVSVDPFESESIASKSTKAGNESTCTGTGLRKSLKDLKSLSKRALCYRNYDEEQEYDSPPVLVVTKQSQCEPMVGSEELAKNIRQLIEKNVEEEENLIEAMKLQLDLAMARQLSGNTCGALIAMKKMKRIQLEHMKYLAAIDFLRGEESKMKSLQEQQDRDPMEWIQLFQGVTKEAEAILACVPLNERKPNEALLDELVRTPHEPGSLSSRENFLLKEMVSGSVGMNDPVENSTGRG